MDISKPIFNAIALMGWVFMRHDHDRFIKWCWYNILKTPGILSKVFEELTNVDAIHRLYREVPYAQNTFVSMSNGKKFVKLGWNGKNLESGEYASWLKRYFSWTIHGV